MKHDDLLDLLLECLPIVETAATDPLYDKSGQQHLLKLARKVYATVKPYSDATSFHKVK